MYSYNNKKLHNTGALLRLDNTSRKIIFIIGCILCLTPAAGPATALLGGLLIAQFIGHPYLHLNHKATHFLLQASVVGLGFGMNAASAWQAGKAGVLFTISSITITFILGFLLSRWLNIEKKTSYLISSGTAICGGSAIAAIAPVIRANEKQISVALGCVFVLNSVALFAYPTIGHYLKLSQTQFGLWCAIAIHDTSSVVGAASKYGPHALEVATTVKLARALWIIPIAFLSSNFFGKRNEKVTMPYFIGLFVLALVVNTYVPAVSSLAPVIVHIAKAGLTLTLFLIGAGLSRQVLASVGFKPLLQGLILWLAISVVSLFAIITLS
ncbi:YeiH family protein [Arcticibacter sp. MXS-1]|uniref:YeiH family protein n=1 Tax=Arcticibacter sp. MXS-1 TaxID=3341726 RepID=UPI0035A81FB4